MKIYIYCKCLWMNVHGMHIDIFSLVLLIQINVVVGSVVNAVLLLTTQYGPELILKCTFWLTDASGHHCNH